MTYDVCVRQLKEALLGSQSKANSPSKTVQKDPKAALDQEMLSIKLRSANDEAERLQQQIVRIQQEHAQDQKDSQNEVRDRDAQIVGLRAQLRDATPASSPRSNKVSPRTPTRSPKAGADDAAPTDNLQMDSKDAGECKIAL